MVTAVVENDRRRLEDEKSLVTELFNKLLLRYGVQSEASLPDEASTELQSLKEKVAEISRLERIQEEREFQEVQQQEMKVLSSGGQVNVEDEKMVMLCCVCGREMVPNPARRCLQCLRSEIDLTEGITRLCVLHHCRQCDRYNKPPYVFCEWESPEMLALCLKKIGGLSKVKVKDASFIYTEIHSERVKVKLVIEKEILNSHLQQTFVVEYIIANQQCDACKQSYTPHTWTAMLQLRQKARHRRTLLYLEQLVLKSRSHEKCLEVIPRPEGMDMTFQKKQDLYTLVNFLRQHLPIKLNKESRQLISQDDHNSYYKHKFSIRCDLPSICRDDLVFLPKSTQRQLGGMPKFCVVRKVQSYITLADPFTLKAVDLNSDKYWTLLPETILTRDHLSSFIVLNMEPVEDVSTSGIANRHLKGQKQLNDLTSALRDEQSVGNGAANDVASSVSSLRSMSVNTNSSGTILVEVELARESDLGQNDQRYWSRTYLGHSINVGDKVLCYDLNTAQFMNATGDTNYHTEGVVESLQFSVIVVRTELRGGIKGIRDNFIKKLVCCQGNRKTPNSAQDAAGVLSESEANGMTDQQIKAAADVLMKTDDPDVRNFLLDINEDRDMEKSLTEALAVKLQTLKLPSNDEDEDEDEDEDDMI